MPWELSRAAWLRKDKGVLWEPKSGKFKLVFIYSPKTS